jgi:hypothetical protein
MKTYRVPRGSADLPETVRQLRNTARLKLLQFGTQKILEKKLSTKTFNYEFDLVNYRSGGQRKSIQKIKDLIQKAVKKQIPYLDYVYGGDILNCNGAQNSALIPMASQYEMVTLTRNSRYPIDVLTRRQWYKAISRYCRYINYKNIQNGIPLHLGLSFNAEIHPSDTEAYLKWSDTSSRSELNIRARTIGHISVSLVKFMYTPYTSIVNGANPLKISTYDEYEKTLRGTDRRQFKRSDNWIYEDLTTRSITRYYPGMEKYAAPEKIFLVLDEMQQVVKTLSRKTSYDTSAFNIGSSEGT